MKLSYPGLLQERTPSGAPRYRVRVRGENTRRITLTCAPGHPEFQAQYLSARAGVIPEPVTLASEAALPKSIGWLVNAYLEHLQARVDAGLSSAKTLKKKRNLMRRLLATPDRVMMIPQAKLVEMQDEMTASPAQADAFIEAVAVMYDWAKKRGHVSHNPARGIDKIYTKGGGAAPWTAADIEQFFAHHRPGTKQHVAMAVLMWTGCRVEDLTVLGRAHECIIDGLEALRWTPAKKGSSEVIIPLLPPLKQATRAPKIQGATYVLGRGGQPFSSGDSMSAMIIRWCRQAGLENRSAHGVRKGLAEILAQKGCTQYELMAILGHSEAKTSETYTRRVERWRLANQALHRAEVSHGWF